MAWIPFLILLYVDAACVSVTEVWFSKIYFIKFSTKSSTISKIEKLIDESTYKHKVQSIFFLKIIMISNTVKGPDNVLRTFFYLLLLILIVYSRETVLPSLLRLILEISESTVKPSNKRLYLHLGSISPTFFMRVFRTNETKRN